MHEGSRIFVAGSRGLVGGAICRKLRSAGFHNLLTPVRSEVDLVDRSAVDRFFAAAKPEYVFLAAARVGGILANQTRPAEFIFENLALQINVIDAAWRNGVAKLEFLGSSCIYPRMAMQPLREDYLMTGPLEPTNQAYAVAKIAGIEMAQSYRRQYGFDAISLMPTNLYGPGDNFDLNHSHVLPALMRKLHDAKVRGASEAVIWGTGSPLREFLHVDDLADAAVFLMRNYSSGDIVNVGTGQEITIRGVAEIIQRVIGFDGRLVNDTSKPDGTPRKLLDVSRLSALGWNARTPLEEGIRQTYEWYLQSPYVAA
ncbi:MAG: GDP-L-fucose synthase [Candidatus Solibacter sp.]